MKSYALIGAALCISLATSSAYARYDEHDAKRDCERKVEQDSRYDGLRNIEVDDQGHDSYRVTGKVRMQGNDASFNCRIRHREVVSWNVRGGHHGNNHHNNNDDDTSTAVAVGAGVLAVAAIAALAASSDDDNDRDHNTARNQHLSGNDNPFEDTQFLRKECKHEIRRHLRQDHGKVDHLRLSQVHLSGRTLRGDGEVQFDYGRARDLSFSCDFDRRGRIHDGRYHYY